MSWCAGAQWRLSRGFNVLMLGSYKEMFCSRAYRRGWRVVRFIDGFAYRTRGRRRHCEVCWRWDSMNGTYDSVE